MTVTVSSSDINLHTELTVLDTVKTKLGVTGSSADALLVQLISEATAFIERYTDRKYAKEVITETLGAHGQPKLLLTRTPVLSVSSVSFNGTTQSSTGYTIDDAGAGILFRTYGWTATDIVHQNVEMHPTGEAERKWSVNYTAGYVMPGSTVDEPRTLPYDIESACIEIVKAAYLNKDEDPNVISQKVGNAAETRNNASNAGKGIGSVGLAGMPATALTILDRWRRADI